MERQFEEYTDPDPSVIGEAHHKGRTVVLISAPGESLNWERLVLFPTLDTNRVLVATPEETMFGVTLIDPADISQYLNDFFTDAITLAEEHFASID